MEWNAFVAIAVFVGLVLLWLVGKHSGQRTLQDDDPGGHSYNYQVPANNGYAYPNNNYQAPQQASGCLQILAVIGFLAVCAACVILGVILAGNL